MVFFGGVNVVLRVFIALKMQYVCLETKEGCTSLS